MKYDKLVRDKIPDIIRDKGGNCKIRFADKDEYFDKLIQKLYEEVSEFSDARNEEELADILEVLDAIFSCGKIDKKTTIAKKKQKAEERGKFNQKIILEEA